MARRPTRNKSRARVDDIIAVDEAFLAEQKVAEEAGGSDTKQAEATSKDESAVAKKDPTTSSSGGESFQSEPGADQPQTPDEGATTFGDGKAWIALDISEDNKQVTVTALSFGGEELKPQSVVDVLRDQFHIKHGFSREALKEVITKAQSEPVARGSFVVAQATTVEPGVDGRVVLKVMQLANSPLFAGQGQKGPASLQDAIMRLGMKKVGAITQQIALVNTFVHTGSSGFDLQRFWEHSLACAVIADRLCEGGLVTLETEVRFNDYWMAALLHDCGKVVQGFFFWEWFERIVRMMDSEDCSFYEAEIEIMGAMVGHDLIGELLMQKAGMPAELVEAVGLHHMPGDSPSPLVALIHVANGLSKAIGLSYIENEPPSYDASALKALNLTRESIAELKELMSEAAVGEVKELVQQCMQA